MGTKYSHKNSSHEHYSIPLNLILVHTLTVECVCVWGGKSCCKIKKKILWPYYYGRYIYIVICIQFEIHFGRSLIMIKTKLQFSCYMHYINSISCRTLFVFLVLSRNIFRRWGVRIIMYHPQILANVVLMYL